MKHSKARMELLRQALLAFTAPRSASGAAAAQVEGSCEGRARGAEGAAAAESRCEEVPEADLFVECSRARPAFVDDGDGPGCVE